MLSTLGRGGFATAALLTDRSRLVAWDDGDHGSMSYTTRLGRRPDLTPPHATVRLLPGTDDQLRESSTAGVRVRCSEACLVSARRCGPTRARTTSVPARRRFVRSGASFVMRFAFETRRDPDRSILRATIFVENSSGAAREVVQRISLR